MAQPRDELGDLEARKLAAFAGLGTLCDLDLDLVAGAEIFGGDTETARRDLLDVAVGIVAICIRLVAFARFGVSLANTRQSVMASNDNSASISSFD